MSCGPISSAALVRSAAIALAFCCIAVLARPALGQPPQLRLMYLESDHELRAAVLAQRLALPLPLHRIGIFRVGPDLYGVIRFSAYRPDGEFASRTEIAENSARLADRIFGELPDLQQLDFEGVSLEETKTVKPEVLFSCTVDRQRWREIPKQSSALERITLSGLVYFDPRVPGAPSAPELPTTTLRQGPPQK